MRSRHIISPERFAFMDYSIKKKKGGDWFHKSFKYITGEQMNTAGAKESRGPDLFNIGTLPSCEKSKNESYNFHYL